MAYTPEFPYKGDQAIINSGRVLLNAKDDSVFVFAKKSIGLSSAGSIHFNSDDVMIINSPKIYLGLNATEPLVKGGRLVDYLGDLNETLVTLGKALTKVKGVKEGVPYIALNTAGVDLVKTVELLAVQVDGLLSKQNYTL
jgi:hypothetical protein